MTDLITRPIRFTADPASWRRILEALGGVLLEDHDDWIVYQLGSGRLALHAALDDLPGGDTQLGFETRLPIDDAVARLAADGAPIRLVEADHGPAGLVQADPKFTVDSHTPGEAQGDPRLLGLQIWNTPDTDGARRLLESLGAKARIVGDAGGWADFTVDGGGLVAFHRAATPAAVLSFEWDGDVEEAQSRLASAGVEAVLLDETYGRTVRFPDPDGGEEIWINERQTDLYGYTRA